MFAIDCECDNNTSQKWWLMEKAYEIEKGEENDEDEKT